MRLAIYYLDTIFHETSDYAFSIYIDYIWTSMMAEFTINIEYLFEMAGMFTFNPWKGFFTIPNSIKSMCFDWAMKIMLLNQFQEGMIRFIAVALYPVLFVSGAILRTFTFTRRLGGLLLGMALALYFVFPAFYAFGGLVIIDLKNNEVVRDAWVTDPMNPGNRMGGEPSLNPPIANSMYLIGDMPMIGGEGRMSTEDAHAYYYASRGMTPGEFLRQYEEGEIEAVDESGETVDFSMAGREGYDFTPNLDEPTDEETEARSLALQRARNVTNQWFDSVSNMNLLQKGFVTMAFQSNGIIDSLSRLTFFSVFFSLFSILGTIAAIRSLSVTFGGDMELAGLTRLI